MGGNNTVPCIPTSKQSSISHRKWPLTPLFHSILPTRHVKKRLLVTILLLFGLFSHDALLQLMTLRHRLDNSSIVVSSGSPAPAGEVSSVASLHLRESTTLAGKRLTKELIAEMRNRSRFIEENCERFGKYTTSDDKLKVLYSAYRTNRPPFIYVPVAKCGWTSWNFILFEDAGKLDILMDYAKSPGAAWAWATPYEKAGLKIYLHVAGVHKIQSQFNESLTFIRHPYKRLVSAYKNRVLQRHRSWCPTKYLTQTSQRIVISFPKAVQCIIDQVATSKQPLYTYAASKKIANSHYIPQAYLAQNCRMKYSLVADFEHYQHNLDAIVEYLQIRTQNDHKNPSTTGLQLTDRQYMEQLSSAQLQQLEEIYSVDFDIFGYNRSLAAL